MCPGRSDGPGVRSGMSRNLTYFSEVIVREAALFLLEAKKLSLHSDTLPQGSWPASGGGLSFAVCSWSTPHTHVHEDATSLGRGDTCRACRRGLAMLAVSSSRLGDGSGPTQSPRFVHSPSASRPGAGCRPHLLSHRGPGVGLALHLFSSSPAFFPLSHQKQHAGK